MWTVEYPNSLFERERESTQKGCDLRITKTLSNPPSSSGFTAAIYEPGSDSATNLKRSRRLVFFLGAKVIQLSHSMMSRIDDEFMTLSEKQCDDELIYRIDDERMMIVNM